MVSINYLTALAAVYLLILALVAYWGNQSTTASRPWVYSLALGVHCTTWAFFGTVTQATDHGWAVMPTYVGSALALAAGYPLLERIRVYCHQNKIYSLADFFSNHLNHSRAVGIGVTLLCLLGIVPYIAQQLDALTSVLQQLNDGSSPYVVAALVCLFVAMYSIVFGANGLSLKQKHPGLLLAIAFESLVKLACFTILGVVIIYTQFDGIGGLLLASAQSEHASQVLTNSGAWFKYLTYIFLGFAAMLCLPRQFHINFVENNSADELKKARWIYPGYLLLFNFWALPLALAGSITLPQQVDNSQLLMSLTLAQNSPALTSVAFIGGLAAATSMVIVATLALGSMVANNLVTPVWLGVRLRQKDPTQLSSQRLLTIRWLTLALVMSLAYCYAIFISANAPLINGGMISIALLAQLLPSMLMSLYSKSTKLGFWLGVSTGLILCLSELLWPSIVASYYFAPAPSDTELSRGVALSLVINLLFTLLGNWLDRHSTPAFEQPQRFNTQLLRIPLDRLQTLQQSFFDHSSLSSVRTHDSTIGQAFASAQDVERVYQILTEQVGRANSRFILTMLSESHSEAIQDVLAWALDSKQEYKFNQEVLNASVQHIEQGICVVDSEQRLVAWNNRYQQMFDYPSDHLTAGTHVRSLLEFNASRGLFGKKDNKQAQIDKRMSLLKSGNPYRYRRHQSDGRVIELSGNPMPGGGFVTTYSDITDFVDAQNALSEASANLEQRVQDRTRELSETNHALSQAKSDAERANRSKNRFIAAASHDLMQPFNAATLFCALLAEKNREASLGDYVSGLQQALGSAESLLYALLDLSRLDSGKVPVHLQPIDLGQLIGELVAEMSPVAKRKGITLRHIRTRKWITSDPALLKRVIRNLISNGIKYTVQGRVLVGVRHRHEQLELQVIDTGLGIPAKDRQVIFEEFKRLDPDHKELGLGLGLTVVRGFCQLLDHPIAIKSTPNKGSCFSIGLPPQRAPLPSKVATQPSSPPPEQNWLDGLRVWIVDNEENNIAALSQLFSSWGAQIQSATSVEPLLETGYQPDLLMIDYHLDNGVTGDNEAKALMETLREKVAVIVHSADSSEEVRGRVLAANLAFVQKPIKPITLKRKIRQSLPLLG